MRVRSGGQALRAVVILAFLYLLSACQTPERLMSVTMEVPSSVTAGAAFTIDVALVGDRGSQPFAGFSGQAALSVTGGAIEPATVEIVEGSARPRVRVTGTTGNVNITVTVSGFSDAAPTSVGPAMTEIMAAPGRDVQEAIPDITFVAILDDYTPTNPDLEGLDVAPNILIVSFAHHTTVAEANTLLRAIGAEIVGGIPGKAADVAGILYLRVPSASHAETNALLETLRANPAVEHVVQDALLEVQVIPGPNAGRPDDWTWELGPEGGNWGLEFVRAPQMWNVNDAVRRSGNRTVTGVLDTGYAWNHEDLVYLANLTPRAPAESHGTHVAGTIGATYDNGFGVDGINPFADLVVIAPERSNAEVLQGFRDLVMARDDLRVVNISMGWDWAGSGIDPEVSAQAQLHAALHGGLFRTMLLNIARDRDLPLIVAAAGNDSNEPAAGTGDVRARFASPWNYAALVLDPPDVFGVSPIVVVESYSNLDGDSMRSWFSNVGGTISAPGNEVLSTSWAWFARTAHYQVMSGTSMAAPHVTGLIGFLYAVAPELTHAQVREVLTRNAVAVDLGPRASDRIDAYATLLDVDRVLNEDRVRLMLLDLDGDGAFTEADVRSFLAAFDAFGPQPIYGRRDLNGDGLTGGGGTARFDLNRDGAYGIVSVETGDGGFVVDENRVTDMDALCFFSYSTTFTGRSDERDALLSGRCTGTDAPNSPAIVDVALPDPETGGLGIDFMFNVDLSGSYDDDIATFRSQAREIVNSMTSVVSDVRFGISSFVDAPCSSFGDLASGDYGHRLDLELTSDFARFQSTLDGLVIRFGRDGPESQLESMYQTMTGAGRIVLATACAGVADIDPSSPGWATDRLRVLLHATDAPFHRPGDVGTDGVPYPYPTNVSGVIATAQATRTRIFVLDAGGAADPAKYEIADATSGGVFLLGSDSSGVVDAVREAAEGAVTRVRVRLVPLSSGFVERVDPPTYEDVDLTETRSLTFTIVFEPWVPAGGRYPFLLEIDGVGVETVHVTVPGAP